MERLLRRDRAITLVGLAVLCALAWLYIVTRRRPRHERVGDDHALAVPPRRPTT